MVKRFLGVLADEIEDCVWYCGKTKTILVDVPVSGRVSGTSLKEVELVPVVLVKDFLKEIEYWEKKTCPVKGVDEQVQGMLIEMKRRLLKKNQVTKNDGYTN